MPQVAEYLPSKRKAQSLMPSTQEKEIKKGMGIWFKW
jgi:hypothetical protein